MLCLLFIALYTSRIVLEKLGVTDYGVYNVVGGLAAMCGFFSSSLSNATERFLNIALGKKDIPLARSIFNQNLLIYTLVAFAVIIVAETVVKWWVFDALVIPPDKHTQAEWVYQFTLLSLAVSLIGTTFLSVIIANERMKIFSAVGVTDGLLKLLIAFLIDRTPYAGLISYAYLSFAETLLVQACYAIYCFRHFPECRLRFTFNPPLLRQMFGFIGWNIFGTGIFMAKDGGVNLLMNIFFGPAVNAARAVALQVSTAVSNFTVNIFTAIRPQMVKAYAAGEHSDLERLFYQSSKFSLLLFWFIALPVLLTIHPLLSVWLTDVPAWAAPFTIWVLIDSMISVLTNPTWTLALASGQLKDYTLRANGMLLLILPLSWIVFRLGASPLSAFIIICIARMLQVAMAARLTCTRLGYRSVHYLTRILLPVARVIIPALIITIPLARLISTTAAHPLLTIILTAAAATIVNIPIIALLGVTPDERHTIIQLLKTRLARKQ